MFPGGASVGATPVAAGGAARAGMQFACGIALDVLETMAGGPASSIPISPFGADHIVGTIVMTPNIQGGIPYVQIEGTVE